MKYYLYRRAVAWQRDLVLKNERFLRDLASSWQVDRSIMQGWRKGCLEQRSRHHLQGLGRQNVYPTLSGTESTLELPRLEQRVSSCSSRYL